MSDDRELLELAAKAAGITIVTWSNAQAGGFLAADCMAERRERFWNPLVDDGDALRLAVKLHIDLDWSHCYGLSDDTVQAYHREDGGATDFEERIGTDPLAATRRAIVRAAAEIGKEMK